MKSITAKLMFLSVIILFVASSIPNILMYFFDGEFGRPDHLQDVTPQTMIFVGAATTFTTIVLYSFVVNRVLIKRVKNVTNATKEVMEGNYETKLKEFGKDEISALIHNFNQMSEELKSNEYLNKEFVRNFSHELKTPLSAIKGYAELLSNPNLTNEEKQEYTRIIIDESSRLSNLSRNMLLISQVDNQMIIPKRDTYNITEQVRNIIQFTQIGWEKKGLSFDLDVKDVKIKSNKELTYQVFSNLISNSIKFSKNNGLIKIEISDFENKVLLNITNQGSLTENQMDRVFDLFYVADNSRSSKSNGVGLSLSKKIIDKLDGEIAVQSQGDFITFSITLNK